MRKVFTQDKGFGYILEFTLDELLIINYIISKARREDAEKYHDYDDEHGQFVMEKMRKIIEKIHTTECLQ